jgi:hypothetical protein
MPPPTPAPTEQPAYPTPAAETYATQQPGPTLRALTPAEHRAGLHSLARLLRRTTSEMPGGAPGYSPEAMYAIDNLVRQGTITPSETDFDLAAPFPGGERGRQRLVDAVDWWRDWSQRDPQTDAELQAGQRYLTPEQQAILPGLIGQFFTYGMAPPPSPAPTPGGYIPTP